MLAEAVRLRRQRRDRPAMAVLPDLLDAMWQNGLREQVEAALKHLAKGYPPWQADPDLSM